MPRFLSQIIRSALFSVAVYGANTIPVLAVSIKLPPPKIDTSCYFVKPATVMEVDRLVKMLHHELLSLSDDIDLIEEMAQQGDDLAARRSDIVRQLRLLQRQVPVLSSMLTDVRINTPEHCMKNREGDFSRVKSHISLVSRSIDEALNSMIYTRVLPLKRPHRRQ